MKRSKQQLAIDLFCGCGGISEGLRMAGFEVIAGVDLNDDYICTFSHNFGADRAIQSDLSSISPQKFMNELGISEGQLDMLAGGPPCQGFSKNVPRRQRMLDDPNNRLIRTFLDYCEALQPKVVLMENVAELKNGFASAYTDEVIRRLEECGYTVTLEVVNSADFGIPQRRRRAFFVANRFGVKFEIPEATHLPIGRQLELLSTKTYTTVWDAIGDLPSVQHGEGSDETLYSCAPFSEYQRLVRNESGVVRNHIARFLQPTQFARLAALEPGQGLKDLPSHLRVKGGYSGAYGRLTKDGVAPTITRWVFHPGSGRWGHPVDIRVLTIREVARIQGFPDSFEFVGTYTKQAGQLGNAVPPLLIKKIVGSALDQLRGSVSAKNSSNLSSAILLEDSGTSKEIMWG